MRQPRRRAFLGSELDAEEMSEPDTADAEQMSFNRGHYAASIMNAPTDQNDEE